MNDNERDRILDKLQKIKAHAESAAKIGSQAEAEAFAAMLQQLLIKHKLELTDLELEHEEAQEPVDRFEVDWQDIRVRSNRVAWIEQLAAVVAKAYFCRILVHPGSSRITLVGRKSDAAVAEYMIVTLTRLAQKLAAKEFGVVYRRDRNAASGFKASFLKSFIARLFERIQEERRGADTSSSTALVRLNRADAAVNDYIKNMRTRSAAMVRGSRQDYNALGWRRGREVANGINLKPNAVSEGTHAARLKS